MRCSGFGRSDAEKSGGGDRPLEKCAAGGTPSPHGRGSVGAHFHHFWWAAGPRGTPLKTPRKLLILRVTTTAAQPQEIGWRRPLPDGRGSVGSQTDHKFYLLWFIVVIDTIDLREL